MEWLIDHIWMVLGAWVAIMVLICLWMGAAAKNSEGEW